MNWLKVSLTVLLCLLGGMRAQGQIQIHHTGNVKGSIARAARPVSLVINPTSGFVAIGKTTQMSVIGTYADASKAEVAGQVNWVSSKTNIATVTSTGLAFGVGSGSTTLTASFPGGPSATATLFSGANGYVFQPEPYVWTDIATTGTALFTVGAAGVDDECKPVIPGMSFTFYGTNYSTVYVSTNGAIIFGAANTAFSNFAIPNVRAPNNLMAVHFSDLMLVNNMSQVFWQVQGTAPNRSLVVQWNNVAHLEYDTGFVTFQAELYEGSNQIVMRYKDVVFGGLSSGGALLDYGQSATVGLENGTGSLGCMYSYNQKALSDGLAIRFIYQVQ